MRTYEERARYILKQRDMRLAKHRRIRTAITMSAVSVCSLALIVGVSVAIKSVIGKTGAVWISGSTSSGVSGTADSRVTAPAAELVYNEGDIHSTYKFTMPEFPGVNFKVENDAVYADDKALYSGMSTVYLADLNGDGCRELCLDTSIGSGIVDQRVWVYDYANSEMYQLSDRGRYDYTLALEDGVLKYKCYTYPVKSGDTPEEEGTLTLSMMTRIPDNGSESSPIVEKLYPRDNSDIEKILELNDDFEFTIPEVSGSFKLVKGVLSRDGEFLHQGYPIHSVYLADLNGDGVREICGEYSVGEGVLDMNIFAYDPKAKELFTLSDTGNKEYVLTLKNDVLGYKHCVVGESGIMTNEEGLLTLSVMNRLCSLPKADSQS